MKVSETERARVFYAVRTLYPLKGQKWMMRKVKEILNRRQRHSCKEWDSHNE